MVHKDPDYLSKYHERNKEKSKKYGEKYRDDRWNNAEVSLVSGKIIDKHKWDVFCNRIKNHAGRKPYSEDFTNEIMFDMMVQGCYFCEDIAMSIDRVDSTLDHTPDNCVGCCHGCNMSKGTADPSTFVRKAYYRARGKYVDDITDIWFTYKNKPTMFNYRKSADNKRVVFELTKECFGELICGNCEYCHRAPTTWFGIDRVVPSKGYVLGNVVSCCFDCNVDKLEGDVFSMMKRNERIAKRVDDGVFVIEDCEKVIIHKGVLKTTKKVCAYGKLYANHSDASRSLGKNRNYVYKCIKSNRYSYDIFEISDQFYEEYKDSENITKTMFIGFDHYYANGV